MTPFLTPEERARVATLFEEILPGTADAPGATDCGAVDYVDRLLSSDYREVPRWRAAYRAGLAAPQISSEFRALLRDHCLEGCFADARHGGNRDDLMWRWYGFQRPAEPWRRPAI